MSRVLLKTILLSSAASAFVKLIHPLAWTSSPLLPQATSIFAAERQMARKRRWTYLSSSTNGNGDVATERSKSPSLNGKVILPVKAVTVGLQGHQLAAVYAVLNSNYKRGSSEGWEHVEHIGITRDLASDTHYFLTQKGSDKVAYIRALSFSYPQKATMEEFANGWRLKVKELRTTEMENWGVVPSEARLSANASGEGMAFTQNNYEFDDEEEMDEDEYDDYLQMMAESRSVLLETRESSLTSPLPSGVISPFEQTSNQNSLLSSVNNEQSPLMLTRENVDKVLEEVRPYLISDGGNVSVEKVDSDTGNVYLRLEGACGSCPSSTVTMKMGIERVLKEKFEERLGEVIQVDLGETAEGKEKPMELTWEAVQAEVNRVSTAINAMGGVVRIVNVDPIGVVEIEFRGPNKVKNGLELALMDVEFVKHVKFVSQ